MPDQQRLLELALKELEAERARGETDRDDPSGILGPNIILDGRRFGKQAPTLPELFQ